ncbi:LCP family protein [Agromyces subbeticus]|uniref:LCP family protein n=1 Tax=Agromyces subbeticus TaxID=293890 RepID=UPI0003B312D6|nr:LCP family protein [Agromyces subbeticus]
MSSANEQVDTEPTEVPRHGRMPRHGAASTYLKLAASVVAVLAVAATSIVAYAAVDLIGDAKPPVELAGEQMLEGVPDIGAMEGGLNFLLVGSDKRPADGRFGDPEEDSAELNDVTMLLHVSQDHSHVEVVSFPRDLVVPVPECIDPADPEGEPLSPLSGVKINTVLAYGGLPCVALTVQQLTGVEIPVGGIVEFYGVAALSEAVGGVEVCLVDPIDDPDAELQLDAGKHSLSGMQALAYLRTRHAVGDGSDLGRISNQQAFLASLVRTLQSSGTLSDPVKLYSIAKAVLSNMTLSTALQNPTQLMAIARTLADVDLSKIVFLQYPTVYTDDRSGVEPSDSAASVNAALQADQPIVLDPSATSESEFGTEADPNTQAPVPDPAATEAPTTQAPPDVTGQRGDEVRCATANEG